MRIISGRYRGRRITGPRGTATRPTSDRVRESLFSILGSRYDLTEAHVLDLFAGSGALGLEALSRGADFVTFVENNRAACECIRKNVGDLGVADCVEVLCRPVNAGISQLVSQSRRFGFVFADPPYAFDATSLIEDVTAITGSGGVMTLEHDGTRSFETHSAHVTTRTFGGTSVSIFEYT